MAENLISKFGQSYFRSDPKIELTETQARESGKFNDNFYVKVIVEKEGLLNPFVRETYTKKEKGKEIYLSYEIDEIAIFKAWENQNFPLVWKREIK